MRKKRLALGVACGLGAVCTVFCACAAVSTVQKIEAELRPDFTIVVDGETRTFKNAGGAEVYPVLYDGTTYLPVRAIGELMGKTVYWYETDKRIELKDGSTVTDADVIVPDGGSGQTAGQGGAGLSPESGEISLEQAKTIAFQKAGVTETDIMMKKAQLELDNGVRMYDIEFTDLRQDSRSVEYSAEIRASDGALIDWDVDEKYFVGTPSGGNQTETPAPSGEITAAQAKEIALQKAGLAEKDVTGLKTEVDMERGTKVYDVEFRQGRKEYSAEISAADGSVLKWEIDND